MPKIQKVTDPTKRVTDPLVLKRLAEQGIDKDYVEFFQDYAPRWRRRPNGTHYRVKESSPYAKFYRDLKSGKRFMVVSGLPMVKPDGEKIECGWLREGNRFESKANLFSAIVEGKRVKLTCLSDQPTGAKKDEQVTWQPQLFVDGSEIINGEQAILLPADPTNKNYHNNVLEWSYGNCCKRRIRIIEGRFRERWIFDSNPHSSVRIKHNFAGNLKLRLGSALDAEGSPLNVSVIGDEEIIEASEFAKAAYPVEIGASATFYPDADPEDTSVDGMSTHYDFDVGLTWANIRAGAGVYAYDDSVTIHAVYIRCHPSNTDRWKGLRRGIILFDTSGLADDAIVSAAILSLFGSYKADQALCTPDTNIYSSNPASNTALEPADFTCLGATPFCDTAITYANFNIGDPGDPNDFALNAAGLAVISKTGITKLGARNANYDVSGSVPNWVADANSWINVNSSDKGAGYKPKLVVTYGIAPTVTTQAVSDIGTATATGNGNITDTGSENCSKRGVCWNTTGNPTVADDKSEETNSFGTGAFTRPMTGLTPGQHYYVKAYAYNSTGYGYGAQVEFTTKEPTPVADGDLIGIAIIKRS